jgi:undecaprenyl-diphosphatase
LLKSLKGGAGAHEDWSALAIAFVVSLLTGFVAVKWLLGYIRSHRYTPLAIYRIALGIALLIALPAGD